MPGVDPFRYDDREVVQITQRVNVLRFFKEYMSYGFRPIFLENADTYLEKVMNTITKAMQSGILFLV